MHIDFVMWRTAIWQLIKMDKKEEWEALDVVSKWLIATRSAVTLVTVYSCVIAGILAWRDGYFSWAPFLIVTLGLFIAHGTNNLLNDYTDYSRGVDKDNYFRTQYGVHPLVQNFWTKRQQIMWFIASGVIAFLSGIFALWYTQLNPTVIGLFAFGSLVLLFYTWPMKYWALGELAIFIIWGPLMIGGVFFVLTGVWSWAVILASLPVGLNVVTINLGKHTDKLREDKGKGVRTLPVLVGEQAARSITMAAIVLSYIITFYLIFVTHFFTPVILLVLAAVKPAQVALKRLSNPRPTEPPPGYPIWPRWFSTVCFVHNRVFSNYFVLALIVDTVLRTVLPNFWR